jgi:hypothetical protein
MPRPNRGYRALARGGISHILLHRLAAFQFRDPEQAADAPEETNMIIDFHAHAFPDQLADRAIETLNAGVPEEAHAVLDGTVGDLLRSMDRAGIDKSVICSIATAPKQMRPILDWSLSIRSDRIEPLGSVHPDCEDPRAAVHEVARAGLRGIKLHALYQDFTLDGDRAWPIYEAVAECGLMIVFHAGRDIAFPPEDDRAAPERILAVHEAFPEIPIVAGHSGGWKTWDDVRQTLVGTEMYIESSYSLEMGEDEKVLAVLEEHPLERVLFGTDSPWCDQLAAREKLESFFADPDERALIMGGNGQRLLESLEPRVP